MTGFAAFTPPPAHPAIVELAGRAQWVAWALVERDGRLTKPPISARTGAGASHSRPADWTTFDQAVAFATSQRMAGVGFVTTDEDGVTGVDLDKCRDPETGDIEPWAREIVDLAETYAEVSPSGRGIRMFWRGKIGETVKADAAHVEIYRSKRYLTVTGRHIEGTPTDIRPAPRTEAALLERVQRVKGEKASAGALPRAVGSQLRENEDGTAIDLETGECFDSLEEAERARITPVSPPVQPSPQVRPAGDDFFRTVNSRALAALPAWVPSIFPTARYHPSTGAYRVSSRDLGRDLEEDLSIAPNGIVDFGVADMGDARQGKRSAIDLAMEYGAGGDAAAAALWLCDRLGTDPASIGWQEATIVDAEAAAIGAQAVAGMMRKDARQAHVSTGVPAPRRGSLVLLDEDQPYVHEPELVRDMLPQTGTAFIGGQSGAGKTFLAIDLAMKIMTGEPFAGRQVDRPGGVLYVAGEGAKSIPKRLKAARTLLPDPAIRLPFALLDKFGAVDRPLAFQQLAGEAIEAQQMMRDRFDVPLSAIILDTVSALQMVPEDRENDPTAWSKVFEGLNLVSDLTGALMIPIHHYGKAASAGLRGSSGIRAGTESVLAMTCERDEITGDVSSRLLSLTKHRDAPEGPIGPVTLRPVVIGQRDDGSEVNSMVFTVDAKAEIVTFRAEKKKSQAERIFDEAFAAALIDHMQVVHVHGEASAPRVRAVDLICVRDEFDRRYVASADDEKKRKETVRKQMKAGLAKSMERGSVSSGSWAGTEWVWASTRDGEADLTGLLSRNRQSRNGTE